MTPTKVDECERSPSIVSVPAVRGRPEHQSKAQRAPDIPGTNTSAEGISRLTAFVLPFSIATALSCWAVVSFPSRAEAMAAVFPGCRRGDRILMWGTTSFRDELTADFGGAFDATSIAVAACFVVQRKFSPTAFWEFCNTICQWATIVWQN
jgi:hypothetical protein